MTTKTIKVPFLILTLLLTASVYPRMRAHAQSPKRLSPTALVTDLYKAHNQKRSPFFQTRSRARLDKYFEKSLADMIWKDAKTSKKEVGALDGDPLYDAQDMEIKKFAINPATYEDGEAKVNVTFENFGQKKSFVFVLVNGRTGWRIQNIEYGEGRSLRGYLKGDG